jgi:hypothetical protein
MEPEVHDMNLEANWKNIRRLFSQAFRSSLHFSMATVTPEGLPHVTPIGSLLLMREPGHAIYFEEFTRGMPRNFRDNQQVCVLAVRSGLFFWLLALIRGAFDTPPAIRLHGSVGPSRAATEDELQLWRRRVGKLRFTRGHDLMWAPMRTVRDVYFTRVDGVRLGAMTRECWRQFEEIPAEAGRGQKLPGSECLAGNSSFDSVASASSPKLSARSGTRLITRGG